MMMMLAMMLWVVLSEFAVADVGIFVKEQKFAFASAYQDNMVLQMQPNSAVLWGYGMIDARVNITLGQETYTTNVFKNHKNIGVWKIALKPQPPGGPHTILASQGDGSKLQLMNVLFGDVWICSGQSNMEFTVSMGFNASKEYEVASNYSNIRLMTPTEEVSPTPLDDFLSIEQSWSLPSKESLGGPNPWTYFSAVCWFYGRYLYDELQIPLGLISPNWGGTPVEAWSSTEALEKCGLNKVDPQPKNFEKIPGMEINQNNNSVLWNAMIHPLLNMTIKGAIWYQGEANAAYHASEYTCSFPAMIEDWRSSWYEGTEGQTHSQFPFGFVQLSTVNVPDDGSFPMLRWAQTGHFGYVPNPKMPNTFMAVAMDLGDNTSPFGSIHPRDKQDVGSRLVLGALNAAYGRHVNPQGPVPVNAIRSADGHVVVTYPNEQQLTVTERGNFEICCNYSTCRLEDPSPSSNWWWAPILAHDHRSVTVEGKSCITGGGQVVLLRYAWALTPCDFKNCSIYNDISLPAPPFVMALSTKTGDDMGGFPVIRWGQTGNYGYVPNPKMPNTFMAVAMDLGDNTSPFGSIHPRDKQDVGSRLVLGGLSVAYGRHVNPQGPVPVNAIRSADGHVVVTYPNEQQITVTEKGNFEICCDFASCNLEETSPSPNWLWAPIVSSDHRSIRLQAQVCIDGGGKVALLRYAWALAPCDFKSCSIYNDIGLPAPPFVMGVTDL